MKKQFFNSIVLVIAALNLFTSCQKPSQDKKTTPENTAVSKGDAKTGEQRDRTPPAGERDQSVSTDPEKPPEGEVETLFSKSTLGFWTLQSGDLPESVKKAADSVFEIRLLAISSDKSAGVLDLNSKETQDMVEKAKVSIVQGDELIEKMILLAQIERCENNEELKRKCPVIFEQRKSTGFLLNSGREFWMTAHSLEKFIQIREKYDGKKLQQQIKEKQPVYIYIFNRAGEMVFNGSKDTALIKELPPVTDWAKKNNRFYAEDSDYVVLNLSKDIGAPLLRAKTQSNLNESIFVMGYPDCTHCEPPPTFEDRKMDYADRSPAPNATGLGLMVTKGEWLDVKKVGPFYQMSLAEIHRWDLNHKTIYSSDSQAGMSGSPVLNKNGEVVSIHTGGKSREIDGKYIRISRGVFPQAWKK